MSLKMKKNVFKIIEKFIIDFKKKLSYLCNLGIIYMPKDKRRLNLDFLCKNMVSQHQKP